MIDCLIKARIRTKHHLQVKPVILDPGVLEQGARD